MKEQTKIMNYYLKWWISELVRLIRMVPDGVVVTTWISIVERFFILETDEVEGGYLVRFNPYIDVRDDLNRSK